MSSPAESPRIPAPEVDPLVWLATEALWSTAKSPFPVQLDRWLTYTDPRDQMSIPGLVIQGNLQRFHTSMRNAEAFADPTGRPDPEFLSQAAEHLGKTAGGLVGIATHFSLSEKDQAAPLHELIPAHVEIAGLSLLARGMHEDTLQADDYYRQLEPVGEAIGALRETKHRARRQELLTIAFHNAAHPATRATQTWTNFLQHYPAITIVPGATPRSSGKYIEDLRADFEQHLPTIREAAIAYRRS